MSSSRIASRMLTKALSEYWRFLLACRGTGHHRGTPVARGLYKPAVSGRPAVLHLIGRGKSRFQGVLWDVARFRAAAAGSTEITAVAPPCNDLVACMPDYRLVIRVQP